MRSRSSWLTLAAFGFLACNAILGNESDYSLADGAGAAGEASGGAPGWNAVTADMGGNAVRRGVGGEAGTVAAPCAAISAVLDALAPLGVTHLDMPATPARVWQAIQEASRQ